MKMLIAALAAATLLAGCQGSSTTNTPTAPGKKNFKYGTGDGLTMSTAVEIRTHSDTDGGILIKDWIRANYPGYTIQFQELREERDRAYNMITIIAPDNSQKNVYFDISMYYRRIGNPNFPKPST
jgi:ABC-type glycerol-3-phosphate transport system substrate-binding protein